MAHQPMSSIQLLLKSRETLVKSIKNIKCLLENLRNYGYFSEEDAEFVLQCGTQADKVRQILDLVENKGEEAAEYFIYILQKVPEAYFDLIPWLKEIAFQASEQVKCLPVKNNDPVSLYSRKLKQELCCDSKFIKSYTQKEEMMLQETYVDGVMELINAKNETMGRLGGLNSLFDDTGVINELGETIFIFGDAGMGKTLLIQKMQNMWAKGHSFCNIKFFFRFRCRTFIFFTSSAELCLKDLIFRYCCRPDNDAEEVFRYICKFPETVLFTFDGYDEIHSSFDINGVPEVSSPIDATHPAALLLHLLSGKLLKGSKKVLTARTGCPISANFVRKKIMLRGFSTDNLVEYTALFFKEANVRQCVLNHLQANHNFSSLCSIPLFCWIIFKSYQHFHSMNEDHEFSGSSVTLTDIFLLIIEVYLNVSTKGKTVSRLEAFTGGKDTLLSIGRLAYNGMEKSVFIFDQEYIASNRILEKDLQLGFLRPVEHYSGCGDSASFEFFHMTLQSFFTALCLVIDDRSSTTDLLKYFHHCKHLKIEEDRPSLLSCVCASKEKRSDPFTNKDHFQFVNLFLCGLLSKPKQNLLKCLVPESVLKKKRKALKQHLFKSVKSHLKKLPRAPFLEFSRVHALPHFIWMVRCISETQNEKVGKLAAKGICADYIKLSFCDASSSDCGAISFVLNYYKKQFALELDNNNINDYGVKELIPCFNKLLVIRLSVNQIGDEGVKVLAEELTKYKIIRFLGLYKNLITDLGARHVARIMEECPSLRHIKLGYNQFTAVGGICIGRALQRNTNIRDIGMWGNRIGDEGAQAFAEALRNHPNLTDLSLTFNEISTSGGISIADALQENKSLKVVWILQNQFNDEVAEHFARMLRVNKTLQNLWLQNNNITNHGANLLTEALDDNINLEEICLQGNPLTPGENEPFERNARIRIN
ncbi:nucleotide-binding oligomerization domain-containing protein 1 isoform X1 [Rana temporaria]|uniref:nucleotide-binding oligomerization domain-containing protein 1 isoform X1 n=1 Tax=Rana temporaria TaxID=8407 RepID=UPI001AADC671|nr:nucleotide-binding oligomerization domain-containing protein 1 isoform X1 [Rana temporaria]